MRANNFDRKCHFLKEMSRTRSKELKDDNDNDNDSKFAWLDVLRIIGGILLLNALLSWAFTSTSTWGYNGRWLDPRYLKFRLTPGYVQLSTEQLALYNGTDPSLPIYLAVDGLVFDVTAGKPIYGPGGSYSKLAGTDSARVFVTGCFMKPDEYTYDLRGLDPEEATGDIQKWQMFFKESDRYWFVGYVTHDVLLGEPPSPCKHMKYPGHQRH